MSAPTIETVNLRSALSDVEVIEQLSRVVFYAGIAQQMLEVGDAPGADYALRRAGAHMRAAIVARNHAKEDGEAS